MGKKEERNPSTHTLSLNTNSDISNTEQNGENDTAHTAEMYRLMHNRVHGRLSNLKLLKGKSHHTSPKCTAHLRGSRLKSCIPTQPPCIMHTVGELTHLLHSDGSRTRRIHTMRETIFDSLEDIFPDD